MIIDRRLQKYRQVYNKDSTLCYPPPSCRSYQSLQRHSTDRLGDASIIANGRSYFARECVVTGWLRLKECEGGGPSCARPTRAWPTRASCIVGDRAQHRLEGFRYHRIAQGGVDMLWGGVVTVYSVWHIEFSRVEQELGVCYQHGVFDGFSGASLMLRVVMWVCEYWTARIHTSLQ
jgi:hypothetical protein